MRQLSSLDAQFLAVESARIYGHVASFGSYDPSTAPGGNLGGGSGAIRGTVIGGAVARRGRRSRRLEPALACVATVTSRQEQLACRCVAR